MLLHKEFESTWPQIFILGLPRSGTTLLYQYIVHRFEVAYFTNGVGTYPLSPCLITWLQHKLYGNYKSDFESNYGKVKGSVAPREAGVFWGRFFDLEEYTCYEDLTPEEIHKLRNIIYCIQWIFGGVPFINKNVKHMLRINALSKIFSNSYFLIVERNLKDVALSMIRGRYKNVTNPNEWWSVRPPNYKALKDLSIAEQVGYQLIALQKKMEADFSKISSERILYVQYEKFCDNPDILVEKMKSMFEPVIFRNGPVEYFEKYTNEPQTLEEKKLIGLIEHAVKR